MTTNIPWVVVLQGEGLMVDYVSSPSVDILFIDYDECKRGGPNDTPNIEYILDKLAIISRPGVCDYPDQLRSDMIRDLRSYLVGQTAPCKRCGDDIDATSEPLTCPTHAYEDAQAGYHDAVAKVQAAAETRVGEVVSNAYPDVVEIVVYGECDEDGEVKVHLEKVIGPGGVVLGDDDENQTDLFDELTDELLDPFGYLSIMGADWLGTHTITIRKDT